MLLRDVKELLGKTGDLRLLKRESGEVLITDLFLNGDGLIRLEQYSTIIKEELMDYSHDGVIDEDSVDELLGCSKLWLLFEEDEATDLCSKSEDINSFLENYDVKDIVNLPKLSFNKTVIEFMDSNIEELLYIGV